jgi:CPA2 family monovalent cation:H+ antiporter-2
MEGSFLLQAMVYLAAATFCVPLAKKLGMGSVLGYLLAGILIGPFVMGFVGAEGRDIMHFAEFGVVMMLFLVGLELEPAKFWKMRQTVLGMGSMQMGLSTVLIFALGMALGLSWQAALATGLAVSMSSTAIVLQSLKEKGLMQTVAGQGSFAILLFQDIAVIPILAILPLLATGQAPQAEGGHHHETFLQLFPAWAQTFVVLGAIALVVASGRFLIVPLLRIVAKTHLRELFTASALLIVIAIAWLMENVGLSPALGTFLAGVVLANSEFRHELESDLDPFKGLLLGLFFIAVGASINFQLILQNPLQITLIVLGLMLVKILVLFLTGAVFRFSKDQNLLLTFGLSQAGEFAFVLFAFIQQLGILSEEWVTLMMGVTALSMTVTPLLLLLNERLILPRVGTPESVQREPDAIDEQYPVIIAGFAHFGSTVGRFLRANGVNATILDNDSNRVDLLRKMGFKVYYGDATRYDLLHAAGAAEAKFIIVAIDELAIVSDLIHTVQKHYPQLTIVARAKNRNMAYELMDMGIQHIYRDTLDTSLRLGVDVLSMMGFRKYSAARSAQNFLHYDEVALKSLAAKRNDMKQYILSVKEQIALQEALLEGDRQQNPTSNDHAWDSEWMRSSILKDNPPVND